MGRGAPQEKRKRRPQTWTTSLLLSSRRSSSWSGSLFRMVPPGLVLLMLTSQTCGGAMVGLLATALPGRRGGLCVCVQLCHLVLVVGYDLGLTLGDLRQTDLNVAAFRVPVAMRHTRLSTGRRGALASGRVVQGGSAEEERACR